MTISRFVPKARDRVEKRVQSGRLPIGPWSVRSGERRVAGEAPIRKLRLDQARAEAMGGSMKIGYVPDPFGPVGPLPQIYRSFGMEGAALPGEPHHGLVTRALAREGARADSGGPLSGRHDVGVDLETDGQGAQSLTLRACPMAGM